MDDPAVPWRSDGEATRILVRLTPKGGRDAIDGVALRPEGAVLLARVRVAPEDGKANAALIATLARELAVPASAIELLAGQTSRQKTVRVDRPLSALAERLAAWRALTA